MNQYKHVSERDAARVLNATVKSRGVGYLEVALQHAVELDRVTYVIPSSWPVIRGEALPPLTAVELQDKRLVSRLVVGDGRKILVGRYYPAKKEFHVLPDDVLDSMLAGDSIIAGDWAKVKSNKLSVLVRRPWTYESYLDNWHTSQREIDAFIEKQKNLGAIDAWVRNATGNIATKPTWGIEYALYPLETVDEGLLLSSYQRARQNMQKIDFEHIA